MTTTTSTTVWINDNGHAVCTAHAGHYLLASIQSYPRRKLHRTPLGTWERLTAAEAALYSPEERKYLACEACSPLNGR